MGRCKNNWCNNIAKHRGMCEHCYKKWLSDNPDRVYDWAVNRGKTCSVNGCNNPAKVSTLCSMHHMRLYRHGRVDYKIRAEKGLRKSHPLEYNSYTAMKTRVFQRSHHQYKDYGGRGIKICDRWLGPDGFEHFLDDMGPRPKKEYSLDRIDPDGDYCPENCRWADRKTQIANRRPRRNAIRILYDGEIMTAREASEKYKVRPSTIYNRIMSKKYTVVLPEKEGL